MDKVEDVGDLHVATVVINVSDMERAVAFWTEALGYVPQETWWNPKFMMLVDPTYRRLPVSLQLTDDHARQPARVHLDLYTIEQQRQVERLIALGATRAENWPYPEDPDFVVLRDPDDNEFCVINQAERTRAV